MTAPQSIEQGIPRETRALLSLRELLSRGPIWLGQLFDEPSLPRAGLLPGGGNVDFRRCLRVLAGSRTVLQLGLLPSLFERLDLSDRMRAPVCLALAQHWLAPLQPALCSFFGEAIELHIDEDTNGWPDNGDSVAFQLNIPALRQFLPARLAAPFVPRLLDLLHRSEGRRRADVPLRLFAGAQIRLPMADVLALAEGDVLLSDAAAGIGDRQIGLYIESATSRRQGRYLASVRADDGLVEHLAPGGWQDASGSEQAPTDGHLVVDVVEAWLPLGSARARALALGQRIEEWRRASWPELAELRIGGETWGTVAQVKLAGQRGYGIVSLDLPSAERQECVNDLIVP